MNAWHEQKPHWAKIWDRFWEGSHQEFGGHEYLIALWLTSRANRHGRQEDGSGLCIWPSGRPITSEDIARKMRWNAETVDQSLSLIIEVGYLERVKKRGGDVLKIPKLKHWQQSPSAERMARMRGSEEDRHSDADCARHSDSTVTPRRAEGQIVTTSKEGRFIFRHQKGVYSPCENTIETWRKAHPKLDLIAVLHRCAAHYQADPGKMPKSERGAKAAITRWLNGDSRAIERPHKAHQKPMTQAQALASQAQVEGLREAQRDHG